MKITSLLHRNTAREYTRFRALVLPMILVLFGSCFIPVSVSQRVDSTYEPRATTVDGEMLITPMFSTTTYLLNPSGTINHSWSSSYFPGCMARWLGDGTILRAIRVGAGPGTGGAGGGVQIVQWDGTVTWDYRYNSNGDLSHHDVRMLPNGNVLLIAWETKTRTEAIAAGRNPNYVTNQGLMPDHIIEVQPTGPTSGSIVWEWHVWDHLIQDYDSVKANYGVVADHPELVDINYVTSSQQDLMHTNSIDYNQHLDQIVISVRYYSEIWVIDHSTTTVEAAGHSGGNCGRGGDLLYRWGNPQAYDRGTSSNRKLYEQHDTEWIDDGCPGVGDILIFNNGVNRGYSTVDEITPPVEDNGSYYLAPGSAYGPTAQTWIYNPQPHFYVGHLAGATRLSSGNTLICNGETGKIFEVTPDGTTVSQYPGFGEVLKIDYIPPGGQEPPTNTPNLDCSGSLSWTDVEPGATVNGSFQVLNVGDVGSLLNWTVNASLLTWGTWSFTPETGENLTPAEGQVTVHVSVVAPDQENSDFNGYIRVENQDNSTDFELIPVALQTPLASYTVQTQSNPFLFQLLQRYSFMKISNLSIAVGNTARSEATA